MNQMTLRTLMEALQQQNRNAPVQFDFPLLLAPTGLHSYRGFSHQLAFSYAPAAVRGYSLWWMCQEAIGQQFSSWKGGYCVGTPDTPLWVSEPWDSSGIALTGLTSRDGVLILQIEKVY